MYFKSIFLSIICSAIAFTAKAQKSLPVFQSWNKDNYPVYVSHIEPLTKGANKLPQETILELKSQYCADNGAILSKLTKKDIITSDPMVTIVQLNESEHVIIPTLFWNVNHSSKDWLEMFQINDFKQKNCEAVAIVDGSITFFVRKSSTEVTVFYYKDLFVFISHNLKKKVSLTEPGIEELIKWLHYVPVKDITKSVEHIIKDIKSKKGDFYSFDFDSSVFDRQLKDL